jgi:8-oxo-dGTP pyrophosphatase MutT (NUDIX family)
MGEIEHHEEEKSVGAFVIDRNGRFLLLCRADNVKSPWEPPKGHQKNGETDKETLARELMEECRISNFELDSSFVNEVRFVNSKGSNRLIVMYIARYDGPIRLSEEHKEYAWLDYHEAIEKLDYHGFPEALKKAKEHIEQKFAK